MIGAVPLPEPVRRAASRFRRPLAAGLAALAVLVTVNSLASSPTPAPVPATRATTVPGEVTVPVPLAVRAVADVLAPGDIVDLVSIADDGSARVVAARARVVEQPDAGGGFTPTTALLLVAVPESSALDLATATAQGAMTVLIHGSTSVSPLDSGT